MSSWLPKCWRSCAVLFIFLLWQPAQADSLSEHRNYTFQDLLPCTLTSLELSRLGADESIEPCILADVQPTTVSQASNNRSALVTSVQVTPVGCPPHRDGAVTAANFLNADNDNQGVAIGFQQDYFVQFRHVSVIAGNPAALGTAEYNRRHTQLLESMVTELGAQYIAGTCSFAAEIEKESARRLKRMVLTMVGPPGFYKDGDDGSSVNPYVFGIHINSDTYGIPAIQQLAFLPNGPETIPIRIIYRKQSEFFFSTCQAIVDAARELGFVDVQTVLYEHDDDHDGDGTINQFDEEFLGLLADQICPSTEKENSDAGSFRPAIFACTLTEQDIILAKWRENGCQPFSMWMTPSTWGWALDNKEVVPYFQGGGQWHPAFSYGDKYFNSGADLLTYNERVFGYRGSYDMVVSYAMVILFAQHLRMAYRILDEPEPAVDFQSAEGYERLRRDMIILNVETIFGTVSFNEFQRNEGRGAAGTQWLPIETNATGATDIENFLVSPFLQAERAAVAPAPVSVPCAAGSFDNVTRTQTEYSLMMEKCSICPIDTFTSIANFDFQCKTCPAESTTLYQSGQTLCTAIDDNLIGNGLKLLGNFGVLCTWVLAIYFGTWTVRHRGDPVIKIGQPEFLLTICVAAMVSSASVIFLGFEAGSIDDENWADIGCRVAPFLYAAGWVTEYSSLSVKTYRLYRITNNQSFQRVQISSYQMFAFMALLLLIEMGLLIFMTIFTPLSYAREITNRDINDNLITIKTSGRCSADNNVWAFLGPLVAIHASLQIITNWLLFKVRGVNDRYQEQKYVALASLFVLEVLVIGVPVLVAVQDSPAARYIVMSAIVVLNDIGILCFVFSPKMKFQKEGLPEGIGVAQSINRESMNRAISRRSQSFVLNSHGGRSVLAGTQSRSPGQSLASDTSASENGVNEGIGGYGRGKLPPFKSYGRQKGATLGGFRLSDKRPLSIDRSSNYRTETGVKSSMAESLHSIMEASEEKSIEDSSSSVKVPGKKQATSSQVSEGKNETTREIDDAGGKPRTELIVDVKERVREKLAKRLAMAEQKNPECAVGIDTNTLLAVGGGTELLGKFSGTEDGFQSTEFETEEARNRLMNRLGAAEGG